MFLVTLEKLEPEDLLWTETDWFPRAMKSGVKYISLAMPKSLTAHMSMDKLAESLDPKQKGYERLNQCLDCGIKSANSLVFFDVFHRDKGYEE